MARAVPWHHGELLAFDLETTGVDRFNDVPVSYALVTVRYGEVVDSDAGLVDPGREIPAAASAVHGISTERARSEGMELAAAVRHVGNVLVDASVRGVPVVGMKLDFDLTMLDSCYRRETGRGLTEAGFLGPVLDALVIDRHVDRYRRGRRTLVDLCAHYGIVIEHAHDASADAKAAADVLRAQCERFPELCALNPAWLHICEEGWHREWATSFDEWRSRKGLSPIADDGWWPIASAPCDEGVRAAV